MLSDPHPTFGSCVDARSKLPLAELVDVAFNVGFLLKPETLVQTWAALMDKFAKTINTSSGADNVSKERVKEVLSDLVNSAADRLRKPRTVARRPSQKVSPLEPSESNNSAKLDLKYTLEDLYSFVGFVSPVKSEDAKASLATKVKMLDDLGLLFDIPSAALSTPFINMLCQHIESFLYAECCR